MCEKFGKTNGVLCMKHISVSFIFVSKNLIKLMGIFVTFYG